MQIRHLLTLIAAAVGQTILLAFAWGFLIVVLLYDSVPIHYSIAQLMASYPSQVTLVVTVIATVLSVATAFCFATALKEALRHRMLKPISSIELASGVALVRGEYLFSLRHFFGRNHFLATLVTFAMFVLANLMVSCWATLLAPTVIAFNTTGTGSELDISSSYFESQLQNLTAGGGIFTQGNSTQIIDVGSLLSGISTAQHSFRVGTLDLDGVLYNVSTGGVLPAVVGYNSSSLSLNNIGLSFGGSTPTTLPFRTLQRQVAPSNFTVLQHGLTADVTCSPAPDLEPQASSLVPISAFTGNDTWLTAWSFALNCTQGNSAQQSFAVLASNGNSIPAVGYVASLICPYPVGQSQFDWTQFNVTTQGFQKYQLLQTMTCQITPKFTMSLVTYSYRTLNAVVVDSTQLTSNNGNLALFLASLVDYLSTSAQSLVSNSLGDVLYSTILPNDYDIDNGGNVNQNLTAELEQYWRGVIEFSGTFLRASFSNAPNPTGEGLVRINGTQTTTTLGWNKRSPIFLYTVLPVTFFALLTYTAFIYSLRPMVEDWNSGEKFAAFDPSNPIHLIMVSSTRELGDEVGNLKGENLGDFSDSGIEKNEEVFVELVDVCGSGGLRKRFKRVLPPSYKKPAPKLAAIKRDVDVRDANPGYSKV